MSESIIQYLNPGRENTSDPEFPHAPEGWTIAKARMVAEKEAIELNADHWEAVKALQEYFAKHEHVHVREIYDALDEKFHAKGGMKYLYSLFTQGPVAQGCRLAGLHAPAGSVNLSFGSVQ